MISDQQLKYFNDQGLIPGPNESEEAFLKRVAFCLNLKATLNSELGGQIPFQSEEISDLSLFPEAREDASKRFGITPDWIPIFFSNYKLQPWHGGCAWIFQLKKETPTAALLQLRKKLKGSKKLLGFYDRDELIAHELSHVGRMVFEEPKFEEVIAYTTSRSPFRRYFGAIFESSTESFLFLITLVGIALLDAYLIWRYPFAYWQAMWLKAIPLAMIAFALFRLIKKQRTFKKCNVDAHILYRLTDNEIALFAKWDRDQIKTYIENQDSLRWRAIRASCAASCCRY